MQIYAFDLKITPEISGFHSQLSEFKRIFAVLTT